MPQKILYLDPFSGISGDMLIGALLDLGVDLARLHHELGKLNLTGYRLSSKRVLRGAMSAAKFDVEIEGRLETANDTSANTTDHDHAHTHAPSQHHRHHTPAE